MMIQLLMLNIVALIKGTVCFISCTAIFCEICFVTAEFAHPTVSQRPGRIKLKKISNFSNTILCLGHEININVNWHVQNL
jgi:hypothetical protein